MSYWLRLAIAFDAFLQAISNKGTFGVTISSRAATAQARGHGWGCWLCQFLDRATLLGFGKDADGTGHCESALRHDRERAEKAIAELTDPTVAAYYARKS
jgi:hypothetical protein